MRKLSLFATIGLCLIVRSLAQRSGPGVPLSLASLQQTFTGESCSDGTGKTSVCTNCTSLSLCLGGNSIAETICPGSNRYCNHGPVAASCSASPAPGCGTGNDAVNPIVCPAIGPLPDLYNCKIYHVCHALKRNSTIHQCPPGYHFNVTRWCHLAATDQCPQIDCGTTSGFVHYGTTPQYFVYCSMVNGVPAPVSIFRCPRRAAFSLTSFSCEYECTKPGRFKNWDDPYSFYQCSSVGGQYESILQRCPNGKIFREAFQYCA